jgi:hypothetical protein
MQKHWLGLTVFILVVGVALYLYTPRRPAPRQAGPAVSFPPAKKKVAPTVTLDLPRGEAQVSFTLPESLPDARWVRVEFSSPDANAPHWTTPPLQIAPGMVNYRGQVTLNFPCEPCREIAPQANYYARLALSATPDAQPLPEYEADDVVPVLLKHR